MKQTDMTLAEQLVWAAAFVTEYAKDAEGRKVGKRDDRLLMYAQKASEVVLDMNRASRIAQTEDPRGRIDVIAIEMLRQMTYH